MSIALSEVRLITASTRFPVRLAQGLQGAHFPVWRLWNAFRGLETATAPDSNAPYRKQLKDEAKRRRAIGDLKNDDVKKSKNARAEKWELTVGIEVHAQLNTERKLFSRTSTHPNL